MPPLLLFQLFNLGCSPRGISGTTHTVCPLIRHLCLYLNGVPSQLSLALITTNYPQQIHKAALYCSVTPTFEVSSLSFFLSQTLRLIPIVVVNFKIFSQHFCFCGSLVKFIFLPIDAVAGVSLSVPLVPLEGGNVSLSCTWTAGTEITVQWGKGGSTVTADSRITISGGSLIINPARRSDAGEYTCTASNPVSAQTATKSLTIYCEFVVIKTRGS